jgi:steroid delta-isomerase-like uncharacterized protein
VPVDENKAVVRAFFQEAINDRDLASLDRLIAADFTHNGEPRGRDGQREAVAAFLAGFSDLHNEIELILGEDELVAARGLWTGTHDGEFMGSPASGTRVSFASTAILRVADGMIAEAWDVVDIGLAAQLGS